MSDLDALERVRAIQGRTATAPDSDELLAAESVDTIPLDSLSGGIDPDSDPGPSGDSALKRVRAIKRGF